MRIANYNARSTHIAIALCAALFSAKALAVTPSAPVIVGEITTVIGQSQILTLGSQSIAERGLPVHSGDRIETGAGGHVHIRFIDGGLVSVRPMSRLLIEDYRNNDTQTLAAIKFKLEEGVMRSVTGKWGEAHRDRFRLNTPVVAIGVKGTDFVVKADGTSTLASVNSGAIIMAPLEGTCASALGPCQGDSAILLSEDMRGTMLQYLRQTGDDAPHLVPAIDLLALRNLSRQQNSGTQHTVAPDTSNAPSMAAAPEVAITPVSAVAPEAAVNFVIATAPDTTLTPTLTGKPPVADTSASNQLQAGVAQASKPLIWLHNPLNWNVPDNTISQRYAQALADGRTPVVGNFFISLYRDETIQKQFSPQVTNATFNLDNVSANYTQPIATTRPVEVVDVTNAQLNVNFAQASLTTHMDLASRSLGQASFDASATITPQGLFNSNTSQQNLAGAFSTTGDQAGYLFDKTFSGGKVSGLSLWSR